MEARVRARPLPRHVAIIMDGNGRWAEARGLPRVAGHREGSASVRTVTREARRLGLEALTLYAFSSQNWARPDDEVGALMQLLAEYLDSERAEILDNGIRLHTIGDTDRLPGFVRERLESVRAASAGNDGMVLTLALSYGGREEIVHAARAAARAGPVDAAAIEANLWTAVAAPARPARAHQRRAAHLQLPPLAGGLRRDGLRRHPLARLPRARPARRHRRLPGPGAPLRAHRRPGGRRLMAAAMREQNRNLAVRVVTALVALPLRGLDDLARRPATSPS